MTVVSDNFNRADSSSLGSDWAEDAAGSSDWEIFSNRLSFERSANAGTSYFKLRWVSTPVGSDAHYAKIYFTKLSDTDDAPGVGVRMAASSAVTGYAGTAFPSAGGGYYISRLDAGSETVVGNAGAPGISGHVLRLEANGSSLTLKADGVTVVSGTDSNHTSGSVGCFYGAFVAGTPNHIMDNWEAGALADTSPFPIDQARNNTDGSTAATNKVCNLPSGLVSGHLLVLMLRSAGADTHSLPTGWTWLVQNNTDDASDDTVSIIYRTSDGGEGATVTINGTASLKFSAVSWRISDWSGTPEISTIAVGSSATPDPTSLSPTGGSKKYLWLWSGSWEGNQTSPPAGNPTNYAAVIAATSGGTAGAASNCRCGGASRQEEGTSEDPPSWTISGTDQWTAYTIAVYPVAVGGQTFVVTLSESMTVSEVAPLKAPAHVIAESETVSDAVIRALAKIIAESETASDAVVRVVYHLIAESETVQDAFTAFLWLQEAVANSITVNDVLTKVMTKVVPTESETIDEAMTKFVQHVVPETTTPADAMVKLITKVIAESITVNDAVLTAIFKTVILSESITVQDALTKAISKVVSESMTPADTVARIVSKVLSESETVSDATVRVYSKVLLESETVSDVVSKVASHVLGESETVSDDFVKTTTRVLAESESPNDTMVKIATKIIAESISISDVVIAQLLGGLVAILSETITVNETVIRIMTKLIAESETAEDTVVRTLAKVLVESETIADVLTKLYSKVVSESETVQDTLRTPYIAHVMLEAMTVQEVLVLMVALGPLTESVTVMDSMVKALTRQNGESITVNDQGARSYSKILAEAEAIVDAAFRLPTKILAEEITISERLVINGVLVGGEPIIVGRPMENSGNRLRSGQRGIPGGRTTGW